MSETAPIRSVPSPCATISSRPLSVVRPARKRSGWVVHSFPVAPTLTVWRIVAPPPQTSETFAAPPPAKTMRPTYSRPSCSTSLSCSTPRGCFVSSATCTLCSPASAPSFTVVTALRSPITIHGERTRSSYGCPAPS